jgi:formylglycine-generating enzyme required for sulfatase activity
MQWMWAAIGATKGNPGGYAKGYAGSTEGHLVTNIGQYAWYTTNSVLKTHEVGKKTANELGLLDMSGNVVEWCWDWYAGSSASISDTGVLNDYTGPAGPAANRVLHGGEWIYDASYCALAFRRAFGPNFNSSVVGFRVVRP